MQRIKKLVHSKSGFTLIELMIAVVISGIIITAVYQLMTSSTKVSNSTNTSISAVNALDSTMDSIRKLTMQATKMTICNASSYSASSGEDVIKYNPDDGCIYYNEQKIGSPSAYDVHRVELKFSTKQEKKVLTVELNCYDENGGLLQGKCRSVDLYMQSIGSDGNGKIATSADVSIPNCIVFSTTN